jgi:hypothetical protein
MTTPDPAAATADTGGLDAAALESCRKAGRNSLFVA